MLILKTKFPRVIAMCKTDKEKKFRYYSTLKSLKCFFYYLLRQARIKLGRLYEKFHVDYKFNHSTNVVLSVGLANNINPKESKG